MKRLIFILLSCVIFVLSAFSINITRITDYISLSVSAKPVNIDENIELVYQGGVFSYNLKDNIKHSKQFDIDYDINKYDRFSNIEKRRELLIHMLDIGLAEDVSLYYLFPNLDKLIDKIERNIFIKPKNAILKIDSSTSKVFHITPEIKGIRVDKIKLINSIITQFLSGEQINVRIPTVIDEPNIVKDDFEKYTHLRADFSTDISRSSADRKHNVKTALNSLNKVEILPNQVFSFNKIVGRRTSANGYRNAKIIVNNEFVDGIGGGVCQVSTTLYNAALLAGLDIVEANKHSKQIHYVKYGFDAMVNFGSSDLKFKNNTNEKITIITNCSSSTARIRIFGADMAGVNYRLSNEISNIVEPTIEVKYDEANEYLDKVEYEDESFILKNSTRGMDIRSYREKYVDGKLVDRELLRTDKYKAQNAVKIYGVKKRTDIECVPEEIDYGRSLIG